MLDNYHRSLQYFVLYLNLLERSRTIQLLPGTTLHKMQNIIFQKYMTTMPSALSSVSSHSPNSPDEKTFPSEYLPSQDPRRIIPTISKTKCTKLLVSLNTVHLKPCFENTFLHILVFSREVYFFYQFHSRTFHEF